MDILSTINKNGSGLNLTELTSSLVTAEIQPKQSAITKRMTATDLSISAVGALRAGLDKLSTAAAAITSTPILSARSSSSAVSVTMTDPSKTTEAATAINVQALATRQVLEFAGFSAKDAVIGAGTITVETGVWVDPATQEFVADPSKSTQTLTIEPGATLEEVAASLTALTGVTARVVDKGDGTFSLGIVGEMGAANGLRFTVTEDPANPGLASLDTTTSIETHQIQSAGDAMIEIDGLTVFRPTNTVTDLVPGTKLELSATGSSTISVARDRETAASNLSFLVDSFNEMMTTLQSLTSRGANGAQKGALAGDSGIEGLASSLKNVLAKALSGTGDPPLHLSDLGLATERNGTMRFDRYRFDAAFDAKPAAFDTVFNDALTTDQPGVSIVGVPADTRQTGSWTFSRPGGDGAATAGGAPAIGTSMGDGRSRFVPLGGGLSGTVITAQDGIEEATVTFNKGMMSMLRDAIRDALSSASPLSKREAALNDKMLADQDALAALDVKSEKLTSRYNAKFTAMEVAISSLKSTGTYLTNLVAQWNKSSN
jgi:flagellar hook-associated protein 2